MKTTESKVVDLYDELPFWSAPFGIKLLEHIEYKKNITALDIGCGAGFPLTEIAMRLGNGSTIVGLDPWSEGRQRASRKIEAYGINNITLVDGVAEHVPLKNASVDLVVSNNGINNCTDTESVLAECSRIIKTGGQLIFTMNLNKTMYEFYDQLEQVLTEYGLTEEIAKMHKHIKEKRLPLEEIKELLNKYNFKVKQVITDQFNYTFTDARTMMEHQFIRLFFVPAWEKLLPDNLVKEIFQKVEERLDLLAIQNGNIKLSVPFALVDSVKQ